MNPETIKVCTIAAVLGIFFGLALEKGRVFEPLFIQQQMTMSKFIMLKMFLAAAGSSLLSFTLISLIFPAKLDSIRSAKPSNTGGVLIGCAILGVGMAISGSCPGTVFAQLGAGVFSSLITLIGGIFAACVWIIIRPSVLPKLNNIKIPKLDEVYIDKHFRLKYALIALPIIVGLMSVIVVVETLFPWYSEYPADQYDNFPSLTAQSWPPYMSGMVIGFLQLPAIILLRKTIGCSTSFEYFAASIVSRTPLTNWEISSLASPTLKNVWQPCYVGGAILGAFLSSVLGGSFGSSSGLGVLPSFVGGFLIIFGARIAGGCTSGHGISGFGKLASSSLLGVPAMFGAGILTAIIFQ